MRAAKLVDYHKHTDKTNPGLWCLKGRRAPAHSNWQHEVDGGNLMIAFRNTDKLISWDAKWDIEEFRTFAKKHGVNYDRRMELEGVNQVIFIEVDRGNEDMGVLRDKIEKYINMSYAFPNDPFVVIFTLQARLSADLGSRATTFRVKVLTPYKKGKQFLIASHEELMSNPLGKVLYSPSDALSILDL